MEGPKESLSSQGPGVAGGSSPHAVTAGVSGKPRACKFAVTSDVGCSEGHVQTPQGTPTLVQAVTVR